MSSSKAEMARKFDFSKPIYIRQHHTTGNSASDKKECVCGFAHCTCALPSAHLSPR